MIRIIVIVTKNICASYSRHEAPSLPLPGGTTIRSDLLALTELFNLHLTGCDDLSDVDGSDDARALRCPAHHLL